MTSPTASTSPNRRALSNRSMRPLAPGIPGTSHSIQRTLMTTFNPRRVLPAAFAALFGCAQLSTAQNISVPHAPPATHSLTRPLLASGKVQHVVIIFQENRSTDNLFNGLAGADTVKHGLKFGRGFGELQAAKLNTPWDPDHSHASFVTEFDGGRMDGFNLDPAGCPANVTCIPPYLRAYNYVPSRMRSHTGRWPSSTRSATECLQRKKDRAFRRTSISSLRRLRSRKAPTLASENPLTAEQKFTGGCDSPVGSLVMLIDANGTEDQLAYPCFERPAFPDLLEGTSLTWRWYQSHPGPGLWAAPDAVKHIRNGSQFLNRRRVAAVASADRHREREFGKRRLGHADC